MTEKVLMKGNEAIAEAALRSGCLHYFGYPITPQTELTAYMAKRLPKMEGSVFLQAESEISAINMVYGVASTGKRVMTSSSSPGVSLKQEGISYITGSDLPAVIEDLINRGARQISLGIDTAIIKKAFVDLMRRKKRKAEKVKG